MGLKNIKKENDMININFIDLIGNVDCSKTKKYTQFLIKMLKYSFKEYNNANELLVNSEQKPFQNLNLETYEGWLTHRLTLLLFGWDEMCAFSEFCEYMEKGLVIEKDISKYDSWDMLKMETYMAKNRNLYNNSKKDIKIFYEDDRFLCLKPLSYESSISYGYQTKWCTSSVNDPSYFYRYSRDGVLVYVIDKINNKKFGFYYSENNMQIYDEKDNRVDSMETKIPFDILSVLFKEMEIDFNNGNLNYKLFGEDTLTKMEDLGYISVQCNQSEPQEDVDEDKAEVIGEFTFEFYPVDYGEPDYNPDMERLARQELPLMEDILNVRRGRPVTRVPF